MVDDDLFLQVAELMAQRSTCLRGQTGAVLVRDRRIIATGYNGAPPGLPHCDEVGCGASESGGCDRAVHAEANVIAFAARHGVLTVGSTLYCMIVPCTACAQLLLSAGVTRVVARDRYRLPHGEDLLHEAGITVEIQRAPAEPDLP